ncbi:tetratricopeptide repeat protein [Haliangium ochraceum]|uniref:tetratricopeptide repeat protein n=1 Tax=Haliangium ochraceum TaxID=80816 RepID=UPI00019B992D|nr:tetratricopeptide repeat protein [Haliangium ochraceum]
MFALGFADGSASLALSDRTCFGWLCVEALELEVPGVSAAPEGEVAAERFQRRRTRLRSLRLSLAPADLSALVLQRQAALADAGFSDLAVHCRDGYLALTGIAQMDEHQVGFSARVYLAADDARLLLLLDAPLVYGFSPVPAPLLCQRALVALTGATPSSDAAGANEGMPRELATGVARIVLSPAAAVLWQLLPAAGWRLPQLSRTRVGELQVQASGVHLVIARASKNAPVSGDDDTADSGGGDPTPSASAAVMRAHERLAEGDTALRVGLAEPALAAYRRRAQAEGGDDDDSAIRDRAIARLLGLCAAARERFDDGRQLARSHQSPEHSDAVAFAAIAALAAMATAEGDERVAAAHFIRLTAEAERRGDPDVGFCASLAAAELQPDEKQAAQHYQHAAALHPEHRASGETLAERFTAEERWDELAELLARRIDSSEQREQVADLVRLAEILHRHLGRDEQARERLARARKIDPVSIPALELEAELDLAAGQRRAAIERLGHVANLWLRQDDEQAAAHAFARTGTLWALEGELEEADNAFGEALALSENAPEALYGAAVLAAQRGKHAAATMLFEQLDAVEERTPAQRARHRLALAQSQLASGSTDEAIQTLRKVIREGADTTIAEAHAVLAGIYRARRGPTSAAAELGAAVAALSRAAEAAFATPAPPAPAAWPREAGATTGTACLLRAVALSQERAGLLDELERADDALAERHRARALSRKLSAIGDTSTAAAVPEPGGDEQRWLDSRLSRPASEVERVDLLLARAELLGRGPRSQSGAAADPGEPPAASPAVFDALQAALGDVDEALASTPSAVQRALALLLRAELLGASGDRDGRAQALLERAALIPTREERAAAYAEAAQAWLAADEPEAAERAVQTGLEALASLRPTERETAPSSTAVRLRALLGDAAWRRRAWSEVVEIYARLLGLAEVSAFPSDDDERAAELDDQQRAALPGWARRLGAAHEARGDHSAAASAFASAVEFAGDDWNARLQARRALARSYEHAGKFAIAAHTFEILAGELGQAGAGEREHARERADALCRAADLWIRIGRSAAAEAADADAAGDDDEDDEGGGSGNDDAAEAQAEAERCYRAALAIAPDHLPTLDALEAHAREHGDFEEVAKVLESKIEATHGHPKRRKALLLRLAAVQSGNLGRLDDAQQSYERVLEDDPNCRPALAFQATRARARGDLDTATRDLARLAHALPEESEPPRGALPAQDRPAPPNNVLERRLEAAESLVDIAVKAPQFLELGQRAVADLLELLPRHPKLRALELRLAEASDAEAQVPRPDALSEKQAIEAARAGRVPSQIADPDELPPPLGEGLPTTQPMAPPAGMQDPVPAFSEGVTEPGTVLDFAFDAVADAPADVAAEGEAAEGDAAAAGDSAESDADEDDDEELEVEVESETEPGYRAPGQDRATWRARADAAREAADYPAYVACLRALAACIPASSRAVHDRDHRAEVLLELADAYAEYLDDSASARKSAREAADAYGPGSRRDLALRMLAAEAFSDGAYDETIAAFEDMSPEQRASGDRNQLALAYQRTGDTLRAYQMLSDLERSDELSDDGAVALFGLRQQRKALRRRAVELVQRATSAERAEALEHLRQALLLYRDGLADNDAADDVQQHLDSLEHAADTVPGLASLADSAAAEDQRDTQRTTPPAAARPRDEQAAEELAGYTEAADDAADDEDDGFPDIATTRTPSPHRVGAGTSPPSPGASEAASASADTSPVPREVADDAETSPVDTATRRRRRARKQFEATRLGVPPVDLAVSNPMLTLPKLALDNATAEDSEASTLPLGSPAAPPVDMPADPSPPRRMRRPTGKRRRQGRITEPGVVSAPARKAARVTITYPGIELDIRKLENAAISTHDAARAAELLAQSFTLRTGRLSRHREPLDDDARAVLNRLRDVARKSGKYRLLVHGLEAAASVGGDPQSSVELLREAATVAAKELDNEGQSVRLLARALEITPGDAVLVNELDKRLRKNGDLHRLIEVYHMHIGALEERARARPLFALGCLYRDLLDDAVHAASYFARAHETNPDFPDVWLPLANVRLAEGDAVGAARLYDRVLERGAPDPDTREWILSRLAAIGTAVPAPAPAPVPAPAPRQRPPSQPSGLRRRSGPTIFHAAGGVARTDSRIEEALVRAANLEAEGRVDVALGIYRQAAEHAPEDQRPLDAITRIYRVRDDQRGLVNVLVAIYERLSEPRHRAHLLLRRGRIYRDALEREAEAYRCFKQAHSAAPDDGEIAGELRRLAMARGEWAIAAELLRREIAAAPTTDAAGALEMELAVLYDEHLLDAERARQHYERALALAPALPGAPRPLARLYELAGRHADAAHMNEMAAAHARDDFQRSRLLYRAAVSAERTGDAAGARRLYHLAALAAPEGEDASASHRALVRLDDKSEAAKRELLELELREVASDEQRIDILRQLLARATHSGDRDAADRHARSLLNMDGADLSSYLLLKSQAEATHDWTALASLLNARAVSLKDRNERAAVYYDLGRLYQVRLDDPESAVKAFERTLAADPAHPAALEALGELAFAQSDWQRARQLYARLRPETCAMPSEELAYRRGVIAETLGYQREALESYARAVEIRPAHREALDALLRLALERGDLPRAIHASRALIDLMPADDVGSISLARLRLAALCERAGDLDAALEYAEMVVSEEPGSQTALEVLVRLYEQKGAHDRAALALRRLIGLVSTPVQRAALLYHLGELERVHRHDLDSAADAYLKAIDLDPHHVPTLRRLLEHFWREADVSELLEIALALSEQGALIDEATDSAALGRVLLAAALRGDERLMRSIARYLGSRLVEVVLETVTATLAHPRRPLDVPMLKRALSELLQHEPALARGEFLESLAAQPATQELATHLRAQAS